MSYEKYRRDLKIQQMSKVQRLIEFFQKHPNFPFNKHYIDYDEYVAASLMGLNVIKYYIPENEIDNWTYAQSYFDIRRKSPQTRTSLIAIISQNREQVFYFALYDSRDNLQKLPAISVAATRDDFYGGKWEENAPQEEWFSIFQITLNLLKLTNYDEVDQLLKNYFNKKLNFDELRIIQESFEGLSDE